MLTSTRTVLSAASLLLTTATLTAQQTPMKNPFLGLMTAADKHARAHNAQTPVLSPLDATLLGSNPPVNMAELHKAGFKVVPWTTNDPAKMRALIDLRVDGIISDYPNLLQQVVKEEAAAHPSEAAYFKSFDVSAHRGGRGLRPENTLPSFEDGLDHLSTTLETDTGVTADHVSLIWHDQFLNPESCRRVDGTPYTLENRVYTRDISLAEAQSTFICDKLHPQFPDQKNDLALSPVAVAFAEQEHLISPYVPTHAEQLFRFTRFYAEYYRTGAGKFHPDAAARAANAEKVRFNLETKILPLPDDPAGPNRPLANSHEEPKTNHTVDPQTFVNTLCGAIVRNHMESQAEVQSFDFRTLILVEEQFPKIPTYYLTGPPKMLSTEFVPVALRQ
ncbi:glycerophosphodiester phosphodiesterase family protein [Tunturibacter empetritectus]|uniref:Glycerophosphoryl diester phosphodiesterase n=1 Tax=Tunturiibacter lichenicola TaxID=2051959 RepID=A0A7W8N3Y7_9BACT|nr:glycerophosphodiester phosphodiesterase family protein [Edaphobacter lichenicola]MBB5344689.1 glycerophosphoryl diester phosphodiesterase [Edaphobacter lichenicola]